MPNGWEPIDTGWLLTLGIVLLVEWLAYSPMSDGSARIEAFLKADPNAVGDTLAGIFSALAFVWIIVTVFMQGTELAAQREELVLTREEMERQREATQSMAESLEAQADIFKDEQRQRAEKRSSECFKDAANQLHRCLFQADLTSLKWHVGPSSQNLSTVKYFGECPHCENPDETLALLAELFSVALRRIRRDGLDRLQYKPRCPKELSQLRVYLGLIVDCMELLPRAKLARLREFHILDAHNDLSTLLKLPIWDQVEEMPPCID
ncbi:hypothetical protein [Shimia thalassica]|nr:hypothetical protein [Shimia thalassica]